MYVINVLYPKFCCFFVFVVAIVIAILSLSYSFIYQFYWCLAEYNLFHFNYFNSIYKHYIFFCMSVGSSFFLYIHSFKNRLAYSSSLHCAAIRQTNVCILCRELNKCKTNMTKTNCELVRDKGSFPVFFLLLLLHVATYREKKAHAYESTIQYAVWGIQYCKEKVTKTLCKKKHYLSFQRLTELGFVSFFSVYIHVCCYWLKVQVIWFEKYNKNG